jgi:uncharacterized membrane protein YeaQ/YmgE (transglycosylase-associated protein family)
MSGLLINLIIQIVSGAVGGNVAGGAAKNIDLGTIGNTIAGAVGGGVGGHGDRRRHQEQDGLTDLRSCAERDTKACPAGAYQRSLKGCKTRLPICAN